MNILRSNGLPETFHDIKISADFRNMIQVDLILHDSQISDNEKTIMALHQLYPQIPTDIKTAIQGLAWFYGRGRQEQDSTSDNAPSKPQKRGFDFEQDANLIYAAFYQTYHISLTTIDFLHWWEFMALFEGLPETTLIHRVMYWRTVDLATLSKEEKKHVQKMRKLYALNDRKKKPMTVEELTKMTSDRVAKRFAEVQEKLQQNS